MSLLASTSGYHQQLPSAQHGLSQPAAPLGLPAPAAAHHCSCCCHAAGPATSVPAGAPPSNSCSGAAAPSLSSSSQLASQVHSQHRGPHNLTFSTFQTLFSSQCEHHMLPFYGRIMVATTRPIGAAAGSGTGTGGVAAVPERDLEHIVAMYTQRLQVQERITHQVADAVAKVSGAGGVMVVVDAAHMCMVARGVENHAGSTTSFAVRGAFADRPEMRRQVLQAFRAAGAAAAGWQQGV